MATNDGGRRVALAVAVLVAGCSAGGPHAAAPTAEERRAPEAAGADSAPQDAGATDAGERPLLYLGETEVESRFDGGAYPAGKPLRVTLEITPPRLSAFREIASRVTQKPASATTFAFELRGYPRAHDTVAPRYRKASFVIDYDEPAVKRAHDKAEAAHGKKPKTADLENFVDDYIQKKDLQRSFDLASQVAERKEGDCTEHAVLLTALARSFGYPARVVFGLVLVQGEGKVFAFGHAWVEYWNGRRWDPLDATPTRKAPDVRYIPTQVLMDEGPAFEAHIMQSMGAALLVKRASVAPP